MLELERTRGAHERLRFILRSYADRFLKLCGRESPGSGWAVPTRVTEPQGRDASVPSWVILLGTKTSTSTCSSTLRPPSALPHSPLRRRPLATGSPTATADACASAAARTAVHAVAAGFAAAAAYTGAATRPLHSYTGLLPRSRVASVWALSRSPVFDRYMTVIVVSRRSSVCLRVKLAHIFNVECSNTRSSAPQRR